MFFFYFYKTEIKSTESSSRVIFQMVYRFFIGWNKCCRSVNVISILNIEKKDAGTELTVLKKGNLDQTKLSWFDKINIG